VDVLVKIKAIIKDGMHGEYNVKYLIVLCFTHLCARIKFIQAISGFFFNCVIYRNTRQSILFSDINVLAHSSFS
jgi:hypothetical protein